VKIDVVWEMNLKIPEVQKATEEATRLGLRDTIVAITNDAIRESPKLTGNNMRSIAAEVSGMGMVAGGGEGSAERVVDDSKLEAAVWSSSGYGGFLETGTVKMPARPYFRPALDSHSAELVPNIARHIK